MWDLMNRAQEADLILSTSVFRLGKAIMGPRYALLFSNLELFAYVQVGCQAWVIEQRPGVRIGRGHRCPEATVIGQWIQSWVGDGQRGAKIWNQKWKKIHTKANCLVKLQNAREIGTILKYSRELGIKIISVFSATLETRRQWNKCFQNSKWKLLLWKLFVDMLLKTAWDPVSRWPNKGEKQRTFLRWGKEESQAGNQTESLEHSAQQSGSVQAGSLQKLKLMITWQFGAVEEMILGGILQMFGMNWL